MHEEEDVKHPTPLALSPNLYIYRQKEQNSPNRYPKPNSGNLNQAHRVQIRETFSTPEVGRYIAHHHHARRRIGVHRRRGCLPDVKDSAPCSEYQGRDEGGPDQKVDYQLEDIGDSFGGSHGVYACEGVV